MKYNQYVRAKSLQEAYDLYQKKNNVVLGGTLWLKMQEKTYGTAIDLCDLGLDQIEETEEAFRIGAYATLRMLETNEALNAYTKGAMREAVKHIVGVQFRNCATVGGSIWGRYGFSDVLTIFRALDAKVELYREGILSLDDFVCYPRTGRDILVSVIVPKKTSKIAYLCQRNSDTDFPVLTCCTSYNEERGWSAVIGATPYMADKVWDEQGFLSKTAKPDPEKIEAFADYVAERIRFDGNMRAGAEYRKIICKVLIRRSFEAMFEQKTEKEE